MSTSPWGMSFDHVSVSVGDPEASRKFYCDVLGFNQTPRPDFGFDGVWLEMSGTPIHLTTGGSTPGASRALRPNEPHFAVTISVEPAVFLEHLEKNGVQGYELQDSPAARWQYFVADPDGNMIEFCIYN
ncbi:VOC family protein [Rhodococcus sp. ACS1]|uniref:VOC family protein n=1 Tax=Rhodococcus sp. ACS1 TaxID=2028570 RepID=UPI0015C949D0|nr:VOC family protein [Rhodococcus sp. ACS1]